MNILRRIFLWLFVFVTLGCFGLFVFVQANGKRLVVTQLSDAFDRAVDAKEVRFIFPVGLRIDNLKIHGVADIKEVRIQVALPFLLTNPHAVSRIKLKEPSIIIHRATDANIVLGTPRRARKTNRQPRPEKAPKKKGAEVAQKIETPRMTFPGVVVGLLKIDQGRVMFSDFGSENNRQIVLEDITFRAQKVPYPLVAVDTKFNLNSTLFSDEVPFSGSQVDSNGWINVVKKNMDAKIKITEPDGKVGLSADLIAENNDLTVRGKVNFSSLSKGRPDDETEESPSVEDLIFGALKTASIEVKADFSFKTKMDNFQVGSVAFAGSFGSNLSAGSITEDLKNIGKKFEDFGKKFKEEDAEESPPAGE